MTQPLAAAALLVLASSALAAPPAKVGKGEGQLNIIAWPGYIERGDTDKKYDWVTDYEKATGCKVNVKTAGTSDEMVALMNQGGYDLVTASGDASLRLVFGKTVQEIDPKLVPSWSTLDPRLKDAPWHTVNGKHYGTPYQFGANFLMYSTEVFKTPPASWDVTLVPMNLPDGKPNKGRVQAYDGPIYLADAAMFLMKRQPELGIKDPYELNEKQYAAVLDLVREQHPLVHRYWHDVTVQMSDFKNEGVVASGAWGFQANALKGEGRPIAVTIPQEGATGWADTTMLHAKAKNVNCAYLWMEHSLNLKLQSALAEWFGANPVVPAACKEKAPGGTDFCGGNGHADFDKIHFWTTPTAKCKTQGSCVPYSRWTTDYIAIMGGR
jgi:putative spermidine/putrescine transport system substrate-binding protein